MTKLPLKKYCPLSRTKLRRKLRKKRKKALWGRDLWRWPISLFWIVLTKYIFRRNSTSHGGYLWSSFPSPTGVKTIRILENTSTQHYIPTAMILLTLRNQSLVKLTSSTLSSSWSRLPCLTTSCITCCPTLAWSLAEIWRSSPIQSYGLTSHTRGSNPQMRTLASWNPEYSSVDT